MPPLSDVENVSDLDTPMVDANGDMAENGAENQPDQPMVVCASLCCSKICTARSRDKIAVAIENVD